MNLYSRFSSLGQMNDTFCLLIWFSGYLVIVWISQSRVVELSLILCDFLVSFPFPKWYTKIIKHTSIVIYTWIKSMLNAICGFNVLHHKLPIVKRQIDAILTLTRVHSKWCITEIWLNLGIYSKNYAVFVFSKKKWYKFDRFSSEKYTLTD